jgi:hypothetical protein
MNGHHFGDGSVAKRLLLRNTPMKKLILTALTSLTAVPLLGVAMAGSGQA